MNNKEILRFVTRVVACLQLITVLDEFTYLPDRFSSLFHRLQQVSVLGGTTPANSYWIGYYRQELGFLILRILLFLAMAMIFWTCPGWLERLLLPSPVTPDQPDMGPVLHPQQPGEDQRDRA
ncbi:MAG: hypothetical protein WCE75_16505 [Terracidiphilus sp.]